MPGDPAADGVPTERIEVVTPAEDAPAASDDVRARRRRRLIGAALGLLAVGGVVGAFLAGTTLRSEPRADPPVPRALVSPTATPTPDALPTGSVLGLLWDQLRGGECFDPYESPWTEQFTVVDCAAPHRAQLTHIGAFPDPPGAPYPGEAALTSQLGLLCAAPTALAREVAAQYADLQSEATYPTDQAHWDAGDRAYSCFMSRASGEPITGSLAPA